jgi:hypothetical protein
MLFWAEDLVWGYCFSRSERIPVGADSFLKLTREYLQSVVILLVRDTVRSELGVKCI